MIVTILAISILGFIVLHFYTDYTIGPIQEIQLVKKIQYKSYSCSGNSQHIMILH